MTRLRLTRITRLDISIINEHPAIGTLVSPTPPDYVRVMTIEHAALIGGHHADRIEVYAAPDVVFSHAILEQILDYVIELDAKPYGDVFWRPNVQENI